MDELRHLMDKHEEDDEQEQKLEDNADVLQKCRAVVLAGLDHLINIAVDGRRDELRHEGDAHDLDG